MKDIERWLKKGLIDEKLAEILNTDLKEEVEKKAKVHNTDCIIHNRCNSSWHRRYNFCSR